MNSEVTQKLNSAMGLCIFVTLPLSVVQAPPYSQQNFLNFHLLEYTDFMGQSWMCIYLYCNVGQNLEKIRVIEEILQQNVHMLLDGLLQFLSIDGDNKSGHIAAKIKLI